MFCITSADSDNDKNNSCKAEGRFASSTKKDSAGTKSSTEVGIGLEHEHKINAAIIAKYILFVFIILHIIY